MPPAQPFPDLPDLRLPPIQIGFVTLAQNEALESLQTLRQALAEIALEQIVIASAIMQTMVTGPSMIQIDSMTFT